MANPFSNSRRAPSSRRILIVSPWGLAGGYSGPLTLLDRLCTALANGGAEIDVIYRDREEESRKPAWATRVFPVSVRTPYSRLQQIRWGLHVRRFIRRHASEYDLVHLHGFYLANQVAVAGISPRVRTAVLPVLDDGDLGHPNTAAWHPKRIMVKAALKSVDVGFALSASIATRLESLGMSAAEIHTIGNLANEEAFAVGEDRQGLHSPIVVGFVGKVGGFKNPDLVLRAVSEGVARGANWSATFVGPFADDPARARIEGLVRDLNLSDRTTFTGFTRDVATHLAALDVFVLPSSQEGLPGALCEAMAAALPCVVTDVGSMATHVRAAGAGLIVEANSGAIAAAISQITGPRWRRYSDNAYSYGVAHFGPAHIAEQYTRSAFAQYAAGVLS